MSNYLWVGGGSGNWNIASNWQVDGNPATSPPGPGDSVSVVPGGATTTITGSGSLQSAMLSLAGAVDLDGQFTTGAGSLVGYGSSLTIENGASLDDTGAFTADYDTALTVSGPSSATSFSAASLQQSFASDTLNGGAITVGGISANSLYSTANNTYTVTAGVFTVQGNMTGGASGSGDTFHVSGGVNGGQFLVDGTVALGSDTVDATNGGVIRFANVTTLPGGSDQFTVDASSIIEIGSADDATAGTFTLDAGQTLTDGGAINAPTIVDDGTIEAGPGESLLLNGSGSGLSGNGSVLIGADAALTIAAVLQTSQNTIEFVGEGGTLALSKTSLAADLAFTPTISGFGSSDQIEYQGDAPQVSYSGDASGGTLTLSNGGATVATLTLSGDYAGDTFYATYVGSTTYVTVSTGGDAATAPAGTSSTDQYVWSPNIAGSWDNPANWVDTTVGSGAAALAPGQNDLVAIAPAYGVTDIVTGVGDSASLTLGGYGGAVHIEGQLSTGAASFEAAAYYASALIDVGASLTDQGDFDFSYPYQSLTVDGTLNVAGNIVENYYDDSETLNDGSATVGGIVGTGYYDYLTINGGVYTVEGSIAIGSYYQYSVSGDGRLDVKGSVALGESDTFSTSGSGSIELDSFTAGASGSDYFYVNSATSSIELGALGETPGDGPAAGSFTLDAGETLTDGGSISAPDVVIDGTLAVGASESLSVTGSDNIAVNGSLTVDAGGSLSMTGGSESYDYTLGEYVWTGGLTGDGAIQIGANAGVTLNGAVDPTSQNTIDFAGAGGVLSLAPSTLSATGQFLPTISGFGSSDQIEYQGDAPQVSYSGDASGGTLTLSNGGATVATLTLQNVASSTSPSFAATYDGSVTHITLLGQGDTSTPPPGTTTPDQYVWNTLSGSWDVAANWVDTTVGSGAAALAPGQNDLVAIAPAYGVTDIVTGVGDSASLTLGGYGGAVHIEGQLSTGAASFEAAAYYASALIDVGASLTDQGDFDFSYPYQSLTVDGTLNVAGNIVENYYDDSETLNDGSATVGGIVGTGYYDYLTINGGVYTVEGSIAIGSYYQYSVSGDGRLDVKGSVALGESDTFSTSGSGSIELDSFTAGASGSDYFYVNSATSSIELGALGETPGDGPAAGSFTLDAGETLTDGGSISAPDVVIDGTLAVGASESLSVTGSDNIAVNGSLTVDAGGSLSMTGGSESYDYTLGEYVWTGGLTGDGAIQIGANAGVTLNGAVDPTSQNTIDFAGAGGVLSLAPSTLSATGQFLPTISGFGSSDQIEYQGDAPQVSYSGDASGGTLTLSNGGATVATLTLSGDYAGDTFYATYVGSTTYVTVSTGGDAATAPAGTSSTDQYVWSPNIAGSWDNPANWVDTTVGSGAAALAPGQNDLVAIAPAYGVTDIVTGVGDSASLTLGGYGGAVHIEGQLSTGAASFEAAAYYASALIDVGASLTDQGDFDFSYPYQSLTVDGTLNVAGNIVENYYDDSETLNDGSATVGGIVGTGYYDYLTINGGVYTVEGSIAIGSYYQYSVSGDGRLDVKGSVALGESDTFSTSGSGSIELDSFTAGASGSDYFYVNSATSSIELGALGETPGDGPAAGSFTLDAGETLTDGGSISAPDVVIDGTLAVGASESLSVTGSDNIAVNGSLTVDAGGSLSMTGGSESYDYTLGEYVWTGGLTGDGAIQIGANAGVTLNGAVDPTSQNTIDFAGAGGVLSLAPSTLSATGQFLPTISGFGSSDQIEYQGDAPQVSYSGDASGGTLTLSNGGATVATLTLSGDYAGDTFYATYVGSTTYVTVSTGGDAATAPAGTSSTDQYVWSPNIAGSWDNPANWVDTTVGSGAAALAPGQNDLVAIAPAYGVTDIVTGVGDSASLTLGGYGGAVHIEGQLSTGAAAFEAAAYYASALIDVGASLTDQGDFDFSYPYQSLTVDGTLNVAGNIVENYYDDSETLNDGSATVGGIVGTGYYDYLTINGGVYTVEGSIAIGSYYQYSVSGDGRLDVKGSVALGESDTFSTSGSGSIELDSFTAGASGSDYFYVNSATSSIELGALGETPGDGPAAGSFTLDAGETLTDGGSISAPDVVIDGTLAVGASESLSVTGSDNIAVNGSLTVDAGGSLSMTGGSESYDYTLGEYVWTGGLTGDGAIQIDANAAVALAGGVDPASQNTIDFAGAGGVFSIAPSTLSATGQFLPTISGFTAPTTELPGDTIDYQGYLTSVSFSPSYTGDTPTGGVLTMLDGSAVVGTLDFVGDYVGSTFYVANDQITVYPGGDVPPTITAPLQIGSGENIPAPVAGVAVYDSTVIPLMTVTLTTTNGVLLAQGGGTIAGSGSDALTISGSVGEVNADLTTLQYEATAGTGDTIAISASNGLGAVANQTIAVVFDPNYPTAPTLTDDSVVDGYVSGVNDTATQALTGETGPGDTVRVYLNGSISPSFTTTADSSGNWSWTIGALANGTYSYVATAEDAAGNVSATSARLNFAVEVTPPAAPTISDASIVGGYVNAANDTAGQTLSGVAEAGSTVTVYLNGSTTPAFATTADPITGNWSVTLGTLADGSYSYAATATDAAGNVSALSSSLSFTVDTVAPTVDMTTVGGPVTTGSQTISGTVTTSEAAPGTTVTLLDNGVLLTTTALHPNGDWSAPVTLPNAGENTIVAQDTDAVGNTGTSNPVTFTLATAVAPAIAAPASATIGVGKPGTIGGVSLSESNTTVGETFTVTLADSNGLLTATGSGVSGSGTTSLSISGSLSQVNADLATLTDADSATPSDAITINASDSNGGTATPATIAVTVNGLPTISAPTTATVVQNQASAISGVSLSESGDTAGESFTVTLSDASGDLSATGTGVSGSGTMSLTIAGSLSQVDSDLATLTDTDSVPGFDIISLNASDSLGDMAAPQAISILAPAPAPALSGAENMVSFDQGGVPVALDPGLGVSDPQSQDLVGATVQITSGFLAGDILTASTAGTNIVASYNGAGTLTLTGADTLADYESVLRSVTFASTSSNATNDGADTSRTITWQVSDGTSSSNEASTTVTVVPPARADLAINSGEVADTILVGEQDVLTFTVTNIGQDTASDATLSLPQLPWLTAASPLELGNLATGQSATISLLANPGNDVALGSYEGDFAINYTDDGASESTLAPFDFTLTSDQSGGLDVQLADGSTNPVQNANVILTNLATNAVAAQLQDVNGSFNLPDLQAGDYELQIYAPDHLDYTQNVTVQPGATTQLDAYLPQSVYSFSWTVVPVTGTDRYEIELTSTFVTDVPVPVLTVNPDPLDFSDLAPGQTEVVDATITNHGLIAAYNLTLDLPDPNDFVITPEENDIPSLAADTSIVVPIMITRDASGATTSSGGGGPPQSGSAVTECPTYGYTSGELTYDYIAGVNDQTVNQSIPIGYNGVYTDGPPCPPGTGGGSVGGGGGGGIGGGGGGGGGPGVTYYPNPVQTSEQGVVEAVTLQIDQNVAVSREAFLGSLDLSASGDTMSDIEFTPVITTLSGAPVSLSLFTFTETSGPALDGGETLSPGQSLQAEYNFLPSLAASANGATEYNIGGTLSFDDSAGQQTVNLKPVTIDVLPQPQLTLDYFWADDVLGPDPFNPQEPSQPFIIGVEVDNVGMGAANDLTIQSAQPQITSNASGLLVNFTIVGSSVNGAVAGNSLTANFGNVAPGATDTAVFDLESSLQGIFENYTANFQNLDALGQNESSIITQVNIHSLVHGGDFLGDGQTDFLTNDGSTSASSAYQIYFSDGTEVSDVGTPTATLGAVVTSGSKITVAIDVSGNSAGWNTFSQVVPVDPGYTLVSVTRADGSDLNSGEFWDTDRTFTVDNPVPTYQNSVNIVDDGDSAVYYATFEQTSPTVVNVATFLANQSSLDQIPGGFVVSDTAANITPALDQLNDPNVTAVTVSDNGAVGASIAQLASDAQALAMLKNADASFYQLAITDTAGDVQTALATLVADTSHIASITATGGTVSVSIATFVADQFTLGKIVGGFAISDSASEIGPDLDLMNAYPSITSITVSDSAPVGVMVYQLTSDAATLAKLQNANGKAYQLAVTGVAAASASAVATTAHVVSVAVSDTAADVAVSLDALQALAVSGELTSIALTDGGTPTLTITASQLTNDATALGDIASPYQLVVTGAPDTPTLTVPGAQTVMTGQALELFGASNAISIADPDASPGETFTLQITHSASNGAGFTILPEGAAVTGSGTGAVTVTGTLNEINATLTTLDYASNNPGVTPGADTITLQVTGSNGGTDTKTIAVTVEPAAPTLQDASIVIGSDGVSYVNAAGDTSSQAITGTAAAGTTIDLYLNGAATPYLTTTTASDGTWSAPIGVLPDGTYSFVATATAVGGYASPNSAALTLTVDTTTSESAIADTAVTTGTDGKGYINAANFDGSSTTLTGTAEAGDTVSVSVNGGAGQAATVTANGSWSLALSGLTDGQSYSAVATATDPAGNTAQSTAFGFAVDTSTTESAIADTAVTTGTDGKGYINAANFDGGSTTLTGTAEAGDTVSVSVNGGAGQAATVAANGSWSLALSGLTDGQSYSAVANATDPAGNTAQSTAFGFAVDTSTTESAIADSAVTTGTDGKSYLNAANFDGGSTTLTGTAEAGDTVSVSVNGGAGQAATVAANGSWSLALSGLTDGQSYSAVATATDPAGNTSAPSAAYAFTVDTETPAVAITSTGGVVSTASQTITGTVSENVAANVVGSTVSLYDNGSTTAFATAMLQSGTGGGLPTWSATVTLSPGSNSIMANDSDLAGNTGASGAVVYTDATIATPAITSATYSGSASTGHWSLSGTAVAGTTVTAYDGATKLGTTTASTTGTWTFATAENESAIRDYTVISTLSAATSVASAPYYEGTPGNDVFDFASEAAVSAAALINGGGGANTLQLTSASTLSDADFAHIKAIQMLGLNSASVVALGTNASTAGITIVTTGNGATSVTDANSGTLTVNAAALGSSSALTLSGSSPATVTTGTGSISIVDGSTGLLTVNAAALAAGNTLTLTGSGAATVTGLKGALVATGESGALTVTATGTAAQTIATGSGNMSITDSAAGGSVTVDATALAAGNTLTLAGSDPETVDNLSGNVVATTLSGALSVTAVGTGTQSVTTGTGATSITDNASGSVTVNANATGAGKTLTLGGSAAETVSNLAENVVATGLSGNLTVTTKTTSLSIATGSGANTITAGLASGQTLTLTGGGAATMNGLSGNLTATSESGTLSVSTSGATQTVTTGTGSISIVDGSTGLLTVNAAALAAGNTLTLTGSGAATVTGLKGALVATGESGALTVTATGTAAQTIATGSGNMSITDSAAGGSVTVDATALAAGNTLTLAGSDPETVDNLSGNVVATTLSGALSVTAVGTGTQSVTTGTGATSITDNASGSVTVNANATGAGKTLTLGGSAAETVSNLAENVVATGLSGNLTVTTKTTSLSIATGSGANTITAGLASGQTLTLTGGGAATVNGLSGNLTATSESGTLSVSTSGATQTVTTGTGSISIVDGSTGLLTVNAAALAAGNTLTLTGSGAATVTGLKGALVATGESGALTVTATGTAAQTIATGSGNMSITDSAAGGSVTVDATALAAGNTLTLAGSDPETVDNLSGNVVATTLSGALSVTAVGTGTQSVTTGTGATSITDNASGSVTVNANATGAGKTLTLGGSAAETVSNLAENVVATGLSGNLTVTTKTTSLSIATGSGANTITAGLASGQTLTLTGGGAATVNGLSGNLTATSESGTLSVSTSGATQTVTTGTGSISIVDGSTGLLTVNAAALAAGNTLTLTGSGAATVTGLKGALVATGESGALTVTATGTAAQTIATGSGNMSITDSAAGGSVTVDATALAAGNTLTLAGSDPETVNNLSGNVVATTLSGALNVTTDPAPTMSIATGTGSSIINASAMSSGQTLTLTGAHKATVSVGGNLAAGGDTGALTVTATGSGPQTIQTGSGKDSIVAPQGGDTIQAGGGGASINVLGHSVADTFTYGATSASPNTSTGHDAITGFAAGGSINDLLDFSSLNPSLNVEGQLTTGASVSANSIAWLYLGGNAMIYVNDTSGSLATSNTSLMEITLNGVTSSLSGTNNFRV